MSEKCYVHTVCCLIRILGKAHPHKLYHVLIVFKENVVLVKCCFVEKYKFLVGSNRKRTGRGNASNSRGKEEKEKQEKTKMKGKDSRKEINPI